MDRREIVKDSIRLEDYIKKKREDPMFDDAYLKAKKFVAKAIAKLKAAEIRNIKVEDLDKTK